MRPSSRYGKQRSKKNSVLKLFLQNPIDSVSHICSSFSEFLCFPESRFLPSQRWDRRRSRSKSAGGGKRRRVIWLFRGTAPPSKHSYSAYLQIVLNVHWYEDIVQQLGESEQSMTGEVKEGWTKVLLYHPVCNVRLLSQEKAVNSSSTALPCQIPRIRRHLTTSFTAFHF